MWMESKEGQELLEKNWEDITEFVILFYDYGFDGICFESMPDGTRRYLDHQDFLDELIKLREARDQIWKEYGTRRIRMTNIL